MKVYIEDFPKLPLNVEAVVGGVTVRRWSRRMWQYRQPNGKWSFPEEKQHVAQEINKLQEQP